MKSELTKRQILQIIRRNMLTKVAPCGKKYNRKDKKWKKYDRD